MRVLGTELLVLISAILALAGAATAEPDATAEAELIAPAAPDPASLERFIDGYVAAIQADGYPPGLMVAVATPDRAFVKAYGLADAETGAPATADTLFRIASVSKTFVWVSVMMLVDEGRLDLGADVNSYLKIVRIPESFGRPVTMNDLMAHRAGFEDTLGDFFESRSGRSFEEALVNQTPKRVAPPGERTSYSNWGTDLAAQIVADVSGVPYDDFVRTRILEPLGMSSTVMRDPVSAFGKAQNDPALDARTASPHKLDAGAAAVMGHDAVDPLNAAGAMSMSAKDAARWIRFFLNEGAAGEARLLSPEAFALMRRRNFSDRPEAPDFAHGFMEAEIAGHKVYGHGGTLTGFISDLTIAPGLRIGVFVSVNGAEAGVRTPDLLSRAIMEQVAGASSYASKWDGGGEDAKAAAEELAGTYLGARRVQSKFERIASVGGDISVAAREDGSLAVSSGAVTRRYYPLTKDLWTDLAEDRLFVYRDAKGAVAGFSHRMGTDTAVSASFLQSSMGLSAALNGVLLLSLTAFLGLWRRLGRDAPASAAGRLIASAHLASAALWLLLIGILVAALAGLSGVQLPELQAKGWPPAEFLWLQRAALAAAFGGALSLALLVPAMVSSGWSVWRKLHYLLFALAGGFAACTLWAWKLVLAPMTSV